MRLLLVLTSFCGLMPAQGPVAWGGYAGNAQHSAESVIAAQALTKIHWSTPVDLNPMSSGGDLDIHYGSAVVTAANTVIVPVKTGLTDGFEMQALNGATGALLYTLGSDYSLPPHNWTPPFGATLTITGHPPESYPDRAGSFDAVRPHPFAAPGRARLYYPGAGGTVYFRDQPDSATGATGQIAFYGNGVYAGNPGVFNSLVQISTPLTADRSGNIYFGFFVQGINPANLVSGVARIAADGSGTWIAAQNAAGGDPSVTQVAMNCAPALSNDEGTLYFAVSTGNTVNNGYLVAVDSVSLAAKGQAPLMDPRGGPATISSDSSASPAVGPDGDVYFGVLEGPCCTSHNSRGWLLHFNSALTQTKIPGSFGWDDTASIVPASLVSSYTGNSAYLVLTKYNNYADYGLGNGVNKLALLDPNASMQDEYSSAPVAVMNEVLTIAGVTPDPEFGIPGAVREWCINTAAIDIPGKAAIVNSEDGTVYRWDFTTNTFTQRVGLTGGRGEAYTPTVIGPDGTAYAINDAILFAIGN